MDEVKAGTKDLHFIEVMTCPGGCVAGGGQPIDADNDAIRSRLQALYKLDDQADKRTSHSNEAVQRLYKDFLGEPLHGKSHELLHTNYGMRKVIR